MINARTQRSTVVQLPQLAAMVVLFLGLSTNDQLDLVVSWPVQQPEAPTLTTLHDATAAQALFATPLSVAASAPSFSVINDPDFVLSASDAELYRAAFAAQTKADWKVADDALAKTKDKRLVGHVLADRYARRDLTLAEAKEWMASYAALPEAEALYEQAQHQRGFNAFHITRPVTVASWTGTNAFGASYGFRTQADNDDTAPKLHDAQASITAKVEAALHRGDPLAARALLATEMQHRNLPIATASELVGHIAAAFFYQGEIERAQPLAHAAAANGAPLGLWIDGLSAWKKQDFAGASHDFATLAQDSTLSTWDRAGAYYWAYRAAKRMGNEAESREWLAEAAKYPRSFYGYMAASLTGHRPNRSWKLPELTAKNIETLSQHPEGWQALALMQIGRSDLAESELRRINPMGQHELQRAVLALAEKAHMPSLTLQLGGVATNDNGQIYEAALYPLPPWQPASGFKVDRALIYALMKRESQFDPEAVSQRGACGLMQIMPSTAHQIANENTSSDCSDRLFDPAINMELGQKYVRVLAGQPMIGDNLMLLLAAYNGGPGKVAHWLDGEDRTDPLLFLESMPIRETHDYVQQVLMHYWMYRSRLAEPENSVAQLARGEWPRYTLHDTGLAELRRAQALELASADSAK